MKKSKNTLNDEINKMSRNDINAIIDGAKSDLPVLNINAVLYGTKYRVKSDEFIYLLKNKLIKSETEIFGIPISDYATAALDILDIQKYNGNETSILRLIKSKSDFAYL